MLRALCWSLLLSASFASAQPCPAGSMGCRHDDVAFTESDVLFDGVMLDSGWVPSGSPLQVRFGVILEGDTQLALAGTAVTSWPAPLTLSVPGRDGTGRLSIDYGFQIVARIRIAVTVAGLDYDWEGDIPFPGGLPRDFRLANEVMFDPFMLPGASARPATVMDETGRFTLFTVDLTDSIIPIPGIGGGFLVDAQGSLTTTYQTNSIEVSDSSGLIMSELGTTTVHPAGGETNYGAAKDLTIVPHGTLDYQGTLTLIPALYVEIVGRRFDLDLTEVPLHIVDVGAATHFDAAAVHIPLPDIVVRPMQIAFGDVVVGQTVEQLLDVSNHGEADLTVMVRDPAAPFTVSGLELTVPPRSTVRLAVDFAPTAAGHEAATLELDSNDPDSPQVLIHLTGNGLEPPHPDAGIADAGSEGGVSGDGGRAFTTAGGCGCRSGGNAPSGWLWGFAIVIARLRRRT